MRNKAIIAFGVVLFLVLAGTGTANALWSSLANLGGTVTSGRIAISQSGFDQLSVEYNASVNQKVAPVTVTNTGSVLLRYTLKMSGNGTNNTIASTANVQTRTVATAAECTPTPVSSAYNWSTLPAPTGMLDPGASVIHCVQTTMPADQIRANNGKSMLATLALTATTAGSWTARADATATQSALIKLPARPANLASSNTSGYSTTLTWADGATSNPAAGNSTATGYNIYRDNELIASNVAGPSYTDVTASQPNRAYNYTVQAVDAAKNTSTDAAPITVTTLNIPVGGWYSVVPPQRSYSCVDVVGGSNRNGSALEAAWCDRGNAQAWSFVPTGDGAYWVSAGHASSSGWFGTSSGAFPVQLSAYTGNAASKWRAIPVGGTGTTTFQFKNEATGRCLDFANTSIFFSPTLVQSTCRSTADAQNQAFAITSRR
jgi:hypothetical protein